MSEAKRVNIRQSVFELAQFMNAYPQGFNKEDFEVGNRFLSLYLNPEFEFNDITKKSLLKETYFRACDDMSSGGQILLNGHLGLQFYENQIQVYETEFENPPLGTILVRIAIQDLIAFNKWRTETMIEIPQHTTNCAIYFLAFKLKDLL